MSRRTLARVTALALASSLALVLILLLPLEEALAGETWVRTTVTHASADQRALAISGPRLVWVDGADSSMLDEPGRVFTWRVGDGSPTRLSSGGDTNTLGSAPAIEGDRIVWAGARTYYYDQAAQRNRFLGGVYTWTPAEGRSTIGTGWVAPGDVDLAGGRIGWASDWSPFSHGLHRFDVWTWHSATGALLLDSGFADAPRVSARRVAWWSGDRPEGGEAGGAVHTWCVADPVPRDISGWIAERVVDGIGFNFPVPVTVSGDTIGWRRWADGEYQDFQWTPEGGKVALERRGGRIAARSWTLPVVWTEGSDGARQIVAWTASTGAVQLSDGVSDNVDPVVSDGLVAWRSKAPGGHYQIVASRLVERRDPRSRTTRRHR